MATEPREAYAWTHPIAYHAGKATGWFFLRNQPESQTFPVFEKQFEVLAEQVRRGDKLKLPEPTALEHKKAAPLSSEEQKKRLAELRKNLSLEE